MDGDVFLAESKCIRKILRPDPGSCRIRVRTTSPILGALSCSLSGRISFRAIKSSVPVSVVFSHQFQVGEPPSFRSSWSFSSLRS
ncbi:MAG: hypothetical protein CMJ57_06960 [Planctomycetaceae bacterium]|nr:hypothetical protein [Planctomycetaceae bacterium]